MTAGGGKGQGPCRSRQPTSGRVVLLARERMEADETRRQWGLHSSLLAATPVPHALWTPEGIRTAKGRLWSHLSPCLLHVLEQRPTSCQRCAAYRQTAIQTWRDALRLVGRSPQNKEIEINLGECGRYGILLINHRHNPGKILSYVFADGLRGSGVPDVTAMELLARDKERESIAREIHDLLGPDIASLRWNVQRNLVALQAKGLNERELAGLRQISVAVDQLSRNVRKVAHGLRTERVLDMGFLETASMLVGETQEASGIHGAFEAGGRWIEPPVEVAEQLYRILRELLLNITKHSKASRFFVKMEASVPSYRLIVRDDGVGFPSASAAAGMGLRSARERASFYGGDLTLKSRPEVPGTEVQVIITAARAGES